MRNNKNYQWYTFDHGKNAYSLFQFDPAKWYGPRYGYFQVFHGAEWDQTDGDGYGEFPKCINDIIISNYNTEQHYVRCIETSDLDEARKIYEGESSR